MRKAPPRAKRFERCIRKTDTGRKRHFTRIRPREGGGGFAKRLADDLVRSHRAHSIRFFSEDDKVLDVADVARKDIEHVEMIGPAMADIFVEEETVDIAGWFGGKIFGGDADVDIEGTSLA